MVFFHRLAYNIFGLFVKNIPNNFTINKSSIVRKMSIACVDATKMYKDVSISELEYNIKKLLMKQGHNSHHSDTITKTLMYAEMRGNNQGIVKLITNGLLPSSYQQNIEVVYDTPISSKVNGNQNIGMVVVADCVDRAITKAKAVGVGIVGCSNYSSATGALGHWTKIITENNYIGICMSQCPEYVAPYGSYEPIFGTNPISIGLPTINQASPVILDMATSTCALYHLIASEQENKPIDFDLAYDQDGQITTDPVQALKGALMVFDRNYKGSHLALVIELLAGAWTGAAMAEKVKSRNWGSLIIVIDPKIFGPNALNEFQENAEIMLNRVKNAKRLSNMQNERIFIPGERGDLLKGQNIAKSSISMSAVVYDELLRQLEL